MRKSLAGLLLLMVALALGQCAATGRTPPAHAGIPKPAATKAAVTAASYPSTKENARRGDRGWLRKRGPKFTDFVNGYSSQVSVRPGATLELHVSTAERYRVLIHRLGWYRGKGGREITCSPACNKDKRGKQLALPPPDRNGKVDAGWPVTDRIHVGKWPTGYYLAELYITRGPYRGTSNYVPFFVTSGRASDILVVAPVNTWQAYNHYGGKSLYAGSPPANRVSFNRPYAYGGQWVFPWEIQLVRFLEREGYDVSYATDVDLERDPSILRRHRVVIVDGHSEYWTRRMRDAYVAARDAGVNLAFMGGNVGVWQIRYEDGERTIVEYRDKTKDPQTDKFRKLGAPPCELVGVEGQGGLKQHTAPPLDYTVVGASDPWFARTGLQNGSVLRNLVGYEWDAVYPKCKPGLTTLLHEQGPHKADATRYTAGSGAFVFAAGSIQFSWALDRYPGDQYHTEPTEPGIQQLVRNMLSDAGACPDRRVRGARSASTFSRPPRLCALELTPSRFRARKRTRVSFLLSEPATVRFRLERRTGGRYRRLRGSFTRRGGVGRNSFRFSGRRLRPGRYRLVAAARSGVGRTSTIIRAHFRIR